MKTHLKTHVPTGYIVLFLLCTTQLMWAQGNQAEEPRSVKQTIFDKKPTAYLSVRFNSSLARVDKSIGLMVGPSMGIMIEDRFFIGLSGSILINERHTKDASYIPVKSEEAYWQMNYGGAQLEYSFSPAKIFHISVGSLLGGGRLTREFICNGLNKQSFEYRNLNQNLNNKGYFFVVEPVIAVEINLTNTVKFSTGVGYKLIEGTESRSTVGMGDSKFSTPSFRIGLQINLFDQY